MSRLRPPEPHCCVECGSRWPQHTSSWPRTCDGCGATTWSNPLPVVVLLVPIANTGQVLAVRRAIPPGLGQLALPSGYLEVGETWREGATRELREETGILLLPEDVSIFAVEDSSTNPNVLLVFASTPPIDTLPTDFTPNDEVSELSTVTPDTPLAFQTHTTVLRRFAG